MKAKITNCLIGLDSLNWWYVPADIIKFKVVVGVVKLSTFFFK